LQVRSALYRGELFHGRRDAHAQRSFAYPIYLASIDPEELPALDHELRWFSHNRSNLFALRDRDYTTRLADVHAGDELPAPHAVRLVTHLRTCGYVFNPVSFFLGYDRAGQLQTAIAEVNNTYGGNFRYVLGPRERIASKRVGFRHVREFFVSPFLHGNATYEFWFDAPIDGDKLAIEMYVESGAQRVFTARFGGVRSPLSDRGLWAATLRYPLMTARVIGLIHLQALKLRLAGVPYRRPRGDHRPLPVAE
jgi:DUF1365 family protein